MATVLLLHSVYGRRPGVEALAEVWRADGHRVLLPDLYDGAVAATLDEAFAIRDRVGELALAQRVAAAATGTGPGLVVAGLSMGAWLAGWLVAARPRSLVRPRGLLLLHGTCELPSDVVLGLPAQLHLADPDPFESAAEVAEFVTAARAAGMTLAVHRYPGVGHLFTDPGLADFDAVADERLVALTRGFLARIGGPRSDGPVGPGGVVDPG
ncbi:MAG: dienelactone hydrolase family protein [Actinomycetes bacterium]